MPPASPFTAPPRVTRAIALAEQHCPLCGADCGWYHGTWPLWRALGIASTPVLHAAFYEEAIAEHLNAGGGMDVLVTGAADPAMLATITGAFAARGRRPRLTVLDRCGTPLVLARDWAAVADVELHTQRRNVLDAGGIGPFDLVCTHAFLGYFSPPARARLAIAWRSFLRPGGRLLTLNRLRPDAPYAPIGFSHEEARRFVERARSEATARHWDAQDTARRARVWTEHFRQWPVHTLEEVVTVLRAADFGVTTRAVQNDTGTTRGLSGPGTPGGARFAGFVGLAGCRGVGARGQS